MIKKFIIIGLLLLMTACSTTPPNKVYYQLTSDFTTNTLQPKTIDNVVFIDSVSVASYLDNTGIVYQTNEIEYSTATRSLWLTTLSNQIQQRVIVDLSALLPNYYVSAMPVESPEATIKLYIDSFHGTYTGDVLIKGKWVISKRNNQIVVKNIDLRLRQSEDGYAGLVKALSKGWQDEELDLIRTVKF